MKKTLTILGAIFISLISLNAQINYFVNAAGDDTNDGSANSPFKTILAASNAAISEGSASEYVIHVSGTITGVAQLTFQFDRQVSVTIKGDGANSTFIQKVTDEAFETIPNPGRIFQLTNVKNSGLTLNIEDLTLRNFGFTNANGGALLNHTQPNIHVALKRCNVYNGISRSGAIAQSFSAGGSLTLENCNFSNITSIMNGDITSAIFFKGGTLTVNNCVFSGFRKNHTDYNSNPTPINKTFGIVIGFQSTTSAIEANIINNTFINNKVSNASFVTAQQSVINANIASVNSITGNIANNIFIDNQRSNGEGDVDINIEKASIWDITNASNNIMNVQVGLDASLNSINAAYTYTSPEINFTMDGNYPEVMTSANGVKYVTANGTFIKGQGITGSFVPILDIIGETRPTPPSIGAVEPSNSTKIDDSLQKTANLNIYSTSGSIIIEGKTSAIMIYNINGSIVKQQVKNNIFTSIPISNKGIYIVIATTEKGKVIRKKVVIK